MNAKEYTDMQALAERPPVPTHAQAPAAFAFEQLHKTFRSKDGGTVTALHDVGFAVRKGEFVTVVGPSGCGKSTLLRILAGLERASSGRVLLGGRAVSGPTRDVGVVFQAPVLLPWRSVLENVLVPAEVQGRVTQVVDVDLPAQRTLELINTDRFGAYVSSIRANLTASGGLD